MTAALIITMAGMVQLVVTLLSGNVAPCLAADDATHLPLADAVLVAEAPLANSTGSVPLSDCHDKGVSELGVCAVGSVRHLLFDGSILHVVGVASKKEVGRINTARIITAGAVVTEFDVARDRAVYKFPSDSMGERNHSASIEHADENTSIASLVLTACPEPATIRLVDVLPKTIRERDSVSAFVCTSAGAESTAAFCELKKRREKVSTAIFARMRDRGTFYARHVGPPSRFGMFRGSQQLMTVGSLASFYHIGA